MGQATILLTLVLFVLSPCLRLVARQSEDDPDRLYEGREGPANARAAAAMWEGRLAAKAGDDESAWKLAGLTLDAGALMGFERNEPHGRGTGRTKPRARTRVGGAASWSP